MVFSSISRLKVMIDGFFPVSKIVSIHRLESLFIDCVAPVGQSCVRVGNIRLGCLIRNILTALDSNPPQSFWGEDCILDECLVRQIFRYCPDPIRFAVPMVGRCFEDHMLFHKICGRVKYLRIPSGGPFSFSYGAKQREYFAQWGIQCDGTGS